MFEIEEITQKLGPYWPVPKFVSDLMEKIPFPYSLVAYEWLRSGDVRTWMLTYHSKSIYYRYRRKLREHGIDISKPSSVILLGQDSCGAAL